MKIIQLKVDDKNYDSFLTIINNLKDGFIKQLTVKSDKETIEVVSCEEQDEIEKILNSMSYEDKEISHTKIVSI